MRPLLNLFAPLKRCEPPPAPTVFHVTHPKAGSQWIRRILSECWPDQVVTPQSDQGQFTGQPLRPSGVYPALYVTREEFDAVRLPRRWSRFVVLRDLRDTLVSAFFSLKVSHPTNPYVLRWRAELRSLGHEEGLLRVLERWLPDIAAIQASWVQSGEVFIRYEDLLEDDLELLGKVLLGDCGLDFDWEKFRAVVRDSRFERLTGGRSRGVEDIASHERKGIAGDWRNHFSERLARRFKDQYGELLVAAGYESGAGW